MNWAGFLSICLDFFKVIYALYQIYFLLKWQVRVSVNFYVHTMIHFATEKKTEDTQLCHMACLPGYTLVTSLNPKQTSPGG